MLKCMRMSIERVFGFTNPQNVNSKQNQIEF